MKPLNAPGPDETNEAIIIGDAVETAVPQETPNQWVECRLDPLRGNITALLTPEILDHAWGMLNETYTEYMVLSREDRPQLLEAYTTAAMQDFTMHEQAFAVLCVALDTWVPPELKRSQQRQAQTPTQTQTSTQVPGHTSYKRPAHSTGAAGTVSTYEQFRNSLVQCVAQQLAGAVHGAIYGEMSHPPEELTFLRGQESGLVFVATLREVAYACAHDPVAVYRESLEMGDLAAKARSIGMSPVYTQRLHEAVAREILNPKGSADATLIEDPENQRRVLDAHRTFLDVALQTGDQETIETTALILTGITPIMPLETPDSSVGKDGTIKSKRPKHKGHHSEARRQKQEDYEVRTANISPVILARTHAMAAVNVSVSARAVDFYTALAYIRGGLGPSTSGIKEKSDPSLATLRELDLAMKKVFFYFRQNLYTMHGQQLTEAIRRHDTAITSTPKGPLLLDVSDVSRFYRTLIDNLANAHKLKHLPQDIKAVLETAIRCQSADWALQTHVARGDSNYMQRRAPFMGDTIVPPGHEDVLFGKATEPESEVLKQLDAALEILLSSRPDMTGAKIEPAVLLEHLRTGASRKRALSTLVRTLTTLERKSSGSESPLDRKAGTIKYLAVARAALSIAATLGPQSASLTFGENILKVLDSRVSQLRMHSEYYTYLRLFQEHDRLNKISPQRALKFVNEMFDSNIRELMSGRTLFVGIFGINGYLNVAQRYEVIRDILEAGSNALRASPGMRPQDNRLTPPEVVSWLSLTSNIPPGDLGLNTLEARAYFDLGESIRDAYIRRRIRKIPVRGLKLIPGDEYLQEVGLESVAFRRVNSLRENGLSALAVELTSMLTPEDEERIKKDEGRGWLHVELNFESMSIAGYINPEGDIKLPSAVEGYMPVAASIHWWKFVTLAYLNSYVCTRKEELVKQFPELEGHEAKGSNAHRLMKKIIGGDHGRLLEAGDRALPATLVKGAQNGFANFIDENIERLSAFIQEYVGETAEKEIEFVEIEELNLSDEDIALAEELGIMDNLIIYWSYVRFAQSLEILEGVQLQTYVSQYEKGQADNHGAHRPNGLSLRTDGLAARVGLI